VVRNDRKAVVAACVDRERRLHAGHGMPIWVRRSIQAPPALRTPLMGVLKKERGSERREEVSV
jgi:hypothetical protein